MLHTINKSPFASSSLQSCIRFLAQNDIILLLEDGVYAAEKNTSQSHYLETLIKNNKVFALSSDIKARGLDNLIDGITVTNYDGFVDLVEENPVQAWL